MLELVDVAKAFGSAQVLQPTTLRLEPVLCDRVLQVVPQAEVVWKGPSFAYGPPNMVRFISMIVTVGGHHGPRETAWTLVGAGMLWTVIKSLRSLRSPFMLVHPLGFSRAASSIVCAATVLMNAIRHNQRDMYA